MPLCPLTLCLSPSSLVSSHLVTNSTQSHSSSTFIWCTSNWLRSRSHSKGRISKSRPLGRSSRGSTNYSNARYYSRFLQDSRLSMGPSLYSRSMVASTFRWIAWRRMTMICNNAFFYFLFFSPLLLNSFLILSPPYRYPVSFFAFFFSLNWTSFSYSIPS